MRSSKLIKIRPTSLYARSRIVNKFTWQRSLRRRVSSLKSRLFPEYRFLWGFILFRGLISLNDNLSIACIKFCFSVFLSKNGRDRTIVRDFSFRRNSHFSAWRYSVTQIHINQYRCVLCRTLKSNKLYYYRRDGHIATSTPKHKVYLLILSHK